jgi:putative ABC transport system ATP-binding protein
MEKLLLNNVSYSYEKSDKNVLNNIHCSFERGSLVSIVGPSGSGKTTLLSLLTGLDMPTEGQIFSDDEDLANMDLDKYRRERIAMIFQNFHLLSFLTVLENVCYPMEQNEVPKEESLSQAKKLLNSLQLPEGLYGRYPANLSGGEQQRVAIARALASGAKFILADEPTGNLDSENSEVLMDILKRLSHAEDYCVVIVSHDPEVASKSDLVYSLRDGTLKQKDVQTTAVES